MTSTSVVILNWNGKHYMERFLPVLISFTDVPEVQIVVADNGSEDGSAEWIKENYPQILLLEFDANYGFTGGYNRALKQLDSDYFLLLNSDIEVTAGWITPLIRALDNNQNIGICMPKIKSAFDRDSFEYAGASGGFIDFFGYPFCRGRILSNIERDNGQYDSDSEIFWASGAAFMIRASLFRQLDGFDDLFFAHMEEVDLCWRAKLIGAGVWVLPESVVYHVGGGTLPNNSPRKLFFNYRNNLLMLYKNLPGKRLYPVLFIRMFMDAVSAFLYLLQGHKNFCKSVFKAHSSFFSIVKEKKVKRAGISGNVPGIYKGSIVFSFFATCKKLKFIDIGSKIR